MSKNSKININTLPLAFALLTKERKNLISEKVRNAMAQSIADECKTIINPSYSLDGLTPLALADGVKNRQES